MAENQPAGQYEDPWRRNEDPDYDSPVGEKSVASSGQAASPSKKPTLKKTMDVVQIPQGKTNFFDLEFNIAAALCYFPLLPIVASVAWLRTEPNINDYLKWHCVQGIVFGGGFLALNLLMGTVEAILNFIPFVGAILGMILILLRALMAVLFTVYCVRQMIDVYKGRPGRLPFASDFTDKFLHVDGI